MELLQALDAFLAGLSPGPARTTVVVAFSGGNDSTALLWGLARLGRCGLVAAHLDHALDGGSSARAAAAARLSAELGVPLVTVRRQIIGRRDGTEAAARQMRYEFLEEVRRSHDAAWVATAHHRDDQAETVLLRLLLGSGCAGLAGIRPVHGMVVRPLLSLPRAALVTALAAAGLSALEDPTNRDLRRPRNLIRHCLLPLLAGSLAEREALSARLARLAERAASAAAALDRRLGGELGIRQERQNWGLDLDRLRRLPRSLWPAGLAALHRRAGAPYPPGAHCSAELAAQVARAGSRVGCDCGAGWHWVANGTRLELRQRREKAPHFTYTLEVPGELEIPELALRLRLARSPVEPWMFRGEPRRAGLELALHEGACVTVRSRLPGDRLQPLGARGRRRLKQILIDRHIPRCERERLPLLCVGEDIVWVPGVTIDQRCRVTPQPAPAVAESGQERKLERGEGRRPERSTVWVAELAPGNPRPGRMVLDRQGLTAPRAEANMEAARSGSPAEVAEH